ncbi:branched-chain amino acid ABC transporter permease [Glaciihabitans sp. dw_435]|uniref:branched-chain amino acid ABC transporter permease n=1 Tax=Glaciihabitans sp. dw_435 TaxID=2720081 RepID=UPI0027DCC2A4|nr:branched-chain amino acid ABC transporter permease [Glaciihabitans sp. dw_435]
MKALRYKPRRATALLALFGFVLGALVIGGASAASATPGTLSAAAVSPADAPQSIDIWIRQQADRSNVAGIGATVTGPGGFSQTVTTGDDGHALVGIANPGSYTVEVDVATIPAAQGALKGVNPRVVAVSADNKAVPAYFILSNVAATPTPGDTNSPGQSSNSDGGPTLAEIILPRVATGLIFGLLLALAAIGVSLIYGTTGLNNFAHGELVTFGGLVGYMVSGVAHLPGWVGIIAALLAGGAFGYVQDLGLWKPLRKRGVALIPLMIVSIGLSLALRYLYQFIFGPGLLVTPNDSSAFLKLGPVSLRSTDVSSPIICILVLLLVAFLLVRTRIGKATRAVADNRSLAAASGINVEQVIRIVWVAGGALAGLAGALIGYYQPVNWETGASILLLIFAAVTLGGLGTTFGALIGSLVIGLLVDLSTIFIPSNMKFVAALLVMIIILIFRPQGILGRKSRIG